MHANCADEKLQRSFELAAAINIVARIKHGSQRAETELVERYQHELRFLVKHRTGDDEFAKEVAQETLLVVLQRLRTKGIEQPEKLSPFVLQTARNIMIGQIRKSARRRTKPDSLQIEKTAGSLEDQTSAAMHDQEAVIVQQLLCEMSCERDRQILERFYLRDQEKSDICRALCIRESHFKRVLYRARKRFAVLVERFEESEQTQLLHRHD